MKKQIQKFLWFLFLGGCMTAPQGHFESYLKMDDCYSVPFQKVIVISDLKKVDSAHHVENKLPQHPKQIIQSWAQKNLITSPQLTDEFHIILHQGEIIRQDFPADHWWQYDYIQDTLYYQIELVQRKDDKVINRLNIGGKNFVKMNKKTSLAEKEKQWANLYNQMLKHLENEITEKIPHVVPVPSKN